MVTKYHFCECLNEIDSVASALALDPHIKEDDKKI